MSNTKIAVRAFYLNSNSDSLAAKLTFPFFYRKLLKWLGEVPGEPDESRLEAFLKMEATSQEDITLVIPLKERVLILWWGTGDGDIHNQVILSPKEMVKQGVVDDEAIDWFWKNLESVIFNNTAYAWQIAVWDSK